MWDVSHWEVSERLAVLGLMLSAALLGLVLLWLYERECDKHEQKWKEHVRYTSIRQEWNRESPGQKEEYRPGSHGRWIGES